jgi:TM2 domain-containing membrane protein YozV
MPKRTSGVPEATAKRPLPPKLVIAAALFLPGAGQMLNGDPIRGITMQFFMMFLAYITYQVTGPEISLLGRIAGGVFVYVVSVLDARAIAIKRMRAWERMTGAHNETKPNGSPKAA